MTICVIDGQGGRIGGAIIVKLKERFKESVEIIALGTNSTATENMMKARANKGASGENAIAVSTAKADLIIGTINIVMANSMLGELTPMMAQAIAEAPARKILLPVSQENVTIIGKSDSPIPLMIGMLVEEVEKEMRKCAR
jgi:hypothetical protein